MKLTNVSLGIIAALFALLIFAVVALEIAGREPDSVLYLAAAVLVPSTLSIVGIKATSDVSKQVSNVKTLVNGNTSRLLDQLEDRGVDVSAERAALGPLGDDDASPRHAAV